MASSRASRPRTLPDAYCSRQPRLPHSQRWPSGTTTMWPNSPAMPVPTALHLPVEHDAAADPGAESHAHQPRLPLPGPEPPLRPGCGVRVVLHHDRQSERCGDRVPQRLVAPGQVRGEQHPRPVGVHEARRADAHRADDVAARAAPRRPRRWSPRPPSDRATALAGGPGPAPDHADPPRRRRPSCRRCRPRSPVRCAHPDRRLARRSHPDRRLARRSHPDRRLARRSHPDRRLARRSRSPRLARSATPIRPASLPSSAARITRCGRCSAPLRDAPKACPGRIQQQVAGLADPAADHHHGRVQHVGDVGDSLAQPSAELGEQARSRRDHLLAPPASPSGRRWRPGRHRPAPAAARPRCWSDRASARAWRISAHPEVYCSQHPRLPHPQGSPPGTIRTCPNSPAIPNAPRSNRPSSTIPPPRPVPTVSRTTSDTPRPPPKRYSPQAAALASFSTTTGKPHPGTDRRLQRAARPSAGSG